MVHFNLGYEDFTKSQLQEIILEAYLSEWDRKLATFYLVEMLFEDEIFARLQKR